MFSLIKQVLIVLFSFSISLARDRTKCLFQMMSNAWLDLLLLNPVELKYYPFMISLDKCTGSFNALLHKYVFQKKENT